MFLSSCVVNYTHSNSISMKLLIKGHKLASFHRGNRLEKIYTEKRFPGEDTGQIGIRSSFHSKDLTPVGEGNG